MTCDRCRRPLVGTWSRWDVSHEDLTHLRHGQSDSVWRLCPSCTAVLAATLEALPALLEFHVKHPERP